MKISDQNNDGIAMDGIDPVAYYNGNPLQGLTQYSFMLKDETYYFSSEENLKAFQDDPAKYMPIIGGYTSPDKMVGDVNEIDNAYMGDKTFIPRKGMEDKINDLENGVPIDTKEDGTVEDQNLSDNEA